MDKRLCACGCGKTVVGNKKKKWYDDACKMRGFMNRKIVNAKLEVVKNAVEGHCIHCGKKADLSLKMGRMPHCKKCWKKYIWMPLPKDRMGHTIDL